MQTEHATSQTLSWPLHISVQNEPDFSRVRKYSHYTRQLIQFNQGFLNKNKAYKFNEIKVND